MLFAIAVQFVLMHREYREQVSWANLERKANVTREFFRVHSDAIRERVSHHQAIKTIETIINRVGKSEKSSPQPETLPSNSTQIMECPLVEKCPEIAQNTTKDLGPLRQKLTICEDELSEAQNKMQP